MPDWELECRFVDRHNHWHCRPVVGGRARGPGCSGCVDPANVVMSNFDSAAFAVELAESARSIGRLGHVIVIDKYAGRDQINLGWCSCSNSNSVQVGDSKIGEVPGRHC